jgi:putative membrane protein
MGVLGWVFGAILLVLVLGLFVGPFFGGYYGMMGPYNAYPLPYFGWFLFPFGFSFVIFILFFAFRWLWFPWRGRYYLGGWYRHRDEAEDILRQRYARGEITKDQFDQMTRDLEQHR